MKSDDRKEDVPGKSGTNDELDYDRLDMKHTPGNEKDVELQSLQERLEQYKKDPIGRPWESAFEKLLGSNTANGSDIC